MAKFQVQLSEIKALGFDFEKAVADHIKDLEAHRTTEGEAAPAALHPWVERSVLRVSYPVEALHQPMHTYERELDGKTVTVTEPIGEPVKFMASEKPDDFVPNYEIVDDTPPLDERKNVCEQRARQAANAAIEKLLPLRKRMLVEMQVHDANMTEPAKRTPAQKAIVAAHESHQQAVRNILFQLALQLHDIEDLTESTIAAWEPAPFK